MRRVGQLDPCAKGSIQRIRKHNAVAANPSERLTSTNLLEDEAIDFWLVSTDSHLRVGRFTSIWEITTEIQVNKYTGYGAAHGNCDIPKESGGILHWRASGTLDCQMGSSEP